MVSLGSSYFVVAHLLIRPDATREELLNAIRHPYARTPSQVVRAASEEAATHGGGEDADAGVGVGHPAGKFCSLHISSSSRQA